MENNKYTIKSAELIGRSKIMDKGEPYGELVTLYFLYPNEYKLEYGRMCKEITISVKRLIKLLDWEGSNTNGMLCENDKYNLYFEKSNYFGKERWNLVRIIKPKKEDYNAQRDLPF